RRLPDLRCDIAAVQESDAADKGEPDAISNCRPVIAAPKPLEDKRLLPVRYTGSAVFDNDLTLGVDADRDDRARRRQLDCVIHEVANRRVDKGRVTGDDGTLVWRVELDLFFSAECRAGEVLTDLPRHPRDIDGKALARHRVFCLSETQ